MNEAKRTQLKAPKTQATVVPKVQSRLQEIWNRCQDLLGTWMVMRADEMRIG